MEIKLIQGDITTAKVDVIVNAANTNLICGNCVYGAIFKASKHAYELQKECRSIGGCKVGSAVITSGYELSKYIIHAVGPVYNNDNDAILLSNAYKESLDIAEKYKLSSIAFPAISIGIFGYPIKEAAKIICSTLLNYKSKSVTQCYLYLYNEETFKVFYDEFIKGKKN